MESLDILLCNENVAPHLKVRASSLTSEHVCLTLLERVLDTKELLSLNVSTETSLDLSCCVLSSELTITAISQPSDETFNVCLNHDQTLALSLKLLPLGVYID